MNWTEVPKPARFLMVGAGISLAAWAYLPRADWLLSIHGSEGTLNASQAHGLCSSSLGQLGQMLSATARHDCGLVDNAYVVFAVLFWGALIALGIAAFLIWSRSKEGT